MRFTLLIFSLLATTFLLAQSDEVVIDFEPTFNGEQITLEKKYFAGSNNDSISLETFKFYISNIVLLQDDKAIYHEEKKAYLIDIEDSTSFTIKLNTLATTEFDKITFRIGLDSLTNVSGALGGALDPTKGMYWTWQSGYINFKLEGYAKSCPARSNRFQFHLGGYQGENKTVQVVEFDTYQSNKMRFEISLEKLMIKVDLKETYQIMNPSAIAKEMSKSLPEIFSLKP